MLAVHPFYVLPPAARGVLTAMQIVLYQGIPTPSKQIRLAETVEPFLRNCDIILGLSIVLLLISIVIYIFTSVLCINSTKLIYQQAGLS